MPKGKRATNPYPPEPAPLKSVLLDAEKPAEKPAEKDNFPETTESVDRLSFKVIDGKLSFDGFRTSTATKAKEAIRKSVTDAEFRKSAGLAEDAAPAAVKLVTPQFFATALNIATYPSAMVLAKRYALETDEVLKLVEWTEREHKLLDEQGADLCNKYIPGAWLVYADLAAFASTILILLKAKMDLVEKYAKVKLERIGKAPSHDEASEQAKVLASVPAPVSVPTNGTTEKERSLE